MLIYHKTNSFCLILKVFHALARFTIKVLSVFAEASKLLHLEVSLFHVAPLFDYFQIKLLLKVFSS